MIGLEVLTIRLSPVIPPLGWLPPPAIVVYTSDRMAIGVNPADAMICVPAIFAWLVTIAAVG